MPPVHGVRLDALTADLRWNLFLALSALCTLIVVLVLVARRWKNRRSNGGLAMLHHSKDAVKHHANLGDIACSDVSANHPFTYLPPPPGSILISELRAAPTPLPHFNSGALAAQAMAKLWPDPALTMEAKVRYSWRRHSHPMSKAISNDETDVSITHDADQYFDDADQNGFWRRRTLVFG